ncbi:kinase-like domain-containing protein [Phaeosphaeria sp. MPI-PUGE-AT-0046c]|nr:kinase-like domain-containing protein [Phaeosphaeria sp. MPI-PUGE-AT-0046c]
MDETLGDPFPLLDQERQPSCDACAQGKCVYSLFRKINADDKPLIESLKPSQTTDIPATPMVSARQDSELQDMICSADLSLNPGEAKDSVDLPMSGSSALGYHTFTWRYLAKEVFVTGSFDGWSKSVRLNRRGDIFDKGVSLPKMRTTYKFVVDGVWMFDSNAPLEENGQGLYNNVLLPEEIVDDHWAEIRRNAAQGAANGQNKDRESGDESIDERVARIKPHVVELTTQEGNSTSDTTNYVGLTGDQDNGRNAAVDEVQLDVTSANPRLDRIFSQLNDESTRQAFDGHDITDLWLPIPKQAVKRLLADDRKTKAFLCAQDDALDTKFRLLCHISIDDDEGHVQELRILGEGACGIVEEVIINPSSTVVRCVRKRIGRPRQLKALKQIMAAFAREIGVMRQVDHHHCVQFMGSYTDVDHINILSSPVADMDLATFLDLPMHDRERKILYRGFGCLCGAINYLHQNDIRHEDLKPQNVLIHGDNIVLTDFGFSLDFSDDSISTTTGRPSAWTIRYSAPEVLDFEPRNRATDIWSLGCILLEMVSAFNGTKLCDLKDRWKHTGNGQSSFARNSEAIGNWFKVEIENPSLQDTVRHFCFLIRSMLHENRMYRPSAQQIVDRIFDIRFMARDDNNTIRIDTHCWGPKPCIGLSHSKAHTYYLLSALRFDLMKYLYPNRFLDWEWGIFDLEWNAIDSDANNIGRSAPWSQVFLENSFIIRAACDEIFEKANRFGTTKAYWEAHKKTSASALSQSTEGRLHARSSAMMLTVKHAIFRRLLLHSSFWTDASKAQSTNIRSVQLTLLPINLPRSPFFGSFFWKLSWPKKRQANELGNKIMDLTSLEWPQ